MQDSSTFQYIAINKIHKSTTNPRQRFEQNKLEELAESIRQHGLIQPAEYPDFAKDTLIHIAGHSVRILSRERLQAMETKDNCSGTTSLNATQLVENAKLSG